MGWQPLFFIRLIQNLIVHIKGNQTKNLHLKRVLADNVSDCPVG